MYFVTNSNDLAKAIKRVEKCELVFHGAGFDVPHIRRWADLPDLRVDHFWDTLYMERLLWSGWYDDFGLDDLTRRYMEEAMDKEERKSFIKGGELTAEMVAYACKDAWATWHIAQKQKELTKEYPNAKKVWDEIDAPAFWAIQDMKGFHMDTRAWIDLAESNIVRYDELVAELGFNPNSPPQVTLALRKLGLRVPSTGEDIIAPYAEKYPVVAKILEARECRKNYGTYGQDFIDKYVEEDGAVHSFYNVTGAKTGRMASDSPNGQNIPHDALHRACFIAKRGFRLLIKDMKQQEPRITAQASLDEVLLKAIAEGEDLHWVVTRAIYGLPDNAKMDKELRRMGKIINLGMVYGLTEYGLAKKAEISEFEAKRLLHAYFQRFRGVSQWMSRVRANGRRTNLAETLAGRFQWCNPHSRQSQNHYVNTPIQGTAADITKYALVLMHRIWGRALPIVGIIHDEIVAEVPTKDAKKIGRQMDDCFVRAFEKFCPDVSTKDLVESHVGTTWADKGA